MDRRRYLVVIGAFAGIAGCAGDVQSPERTSTPTASDVSPGTSTQTATTAPLGTNTSEETEQTQTESKTRTVNPNIERAAELLDRASRQLEQAAEYFDEQAGDRANAPPGILDIDASSEDFSPNDVLDRAGAADDTLDDIEGLAREEFPDRYNTLRTLQVFLLEGAWAQSDAIQAYDDLESIWPTYDVADVEMGGSTDDLEGELDQFSERLEAIQEENQLEDFEPLGPLTPEVYHDKIDQFDDELGAFNAIIDALEELVNDNESPGDAYDILSNSSKPESLEDKIEELSCVASNMPESKELQGDAEAAEKDGNTNTAKRLRDEAKEILQQCAD